jgi:aldose 1-epimerase
LKAHQIQNNHLKISTLDFGATLHQLWVKDKSGRAVNVVLGFDDIDQYLDNPFSIGSSIGRYAGRISGGGFHIDGNFYPVHTENGVHLHGGKNGFDKVYWTLSAVTETSITYQLDSQNEDEGYPGNLQAEVTYALHENSLTIEYKAKTDQKTIVNLTNHAYYNLDGEGDILNHTLFLDSEKYLETDLKQLPTGNFLPVENTCFDFRKPKTIGKQSGFKGIDDCFMHQKSQLHIGSLYSPKSGIEMRVETNQPSVVIFTPEHFGRTNSLFEDNFSKFSSICFETQLPPDAPNHPDFPNPILNIGKIYLNKSVFNFDII